MTTEEGSSNATTTPIAAPQPQQQEQRRRRRGKKSREEGSKKTDANTPTTTNTTTNTTAVGSKKRTLPQNENDTTTTTTKQTKTPKNKRHKKPKKGTAPKPGDAGFLTPTQMRNARKRRAKQEQRQQQDGGGVSNYMISVAKPDGSGDDHVAAPAGGSGSSTGRSNTNNGSGKRTGSSRVISPPNQHHSSGVGGRGYSDDPSMKYIANPRSAPIVQQAIQYFNNNSPEALLPSTSPPFRTHVGPTTGWRTVSKLAVRRSLSNNNNKGTTIIGLFKPHTHDIVSVSNSPAHHPSINATIKVLQERCDELGIEPYCESDGSGFLRYVCMNVERGTGDVQITLVWNSTPYDDDTPGGGIDSGDSGRVQLKSLCDTIIFLGRSSTSSSTTEDTNKQTIGSRSIKLHSLWVHHNAQWKHSAGIFDFGNNNSITSSSSSVPLWKHLHGPKCITETLDLSSSSNTMRDDTNSNKNQPSHKAAPPLYFPPNVFRQANLTAFNDIVVAIRNYLIQYHRERQEVSPSSTTIAAAASGLELYGGVGTIGLNVCDLLGSLVSSDENPHNKECFERSIIASRSSSSSNSNDDDDDPKYRYVPKNATDMITSMTTLNSDSSDGVVGEISSSEILIVDPPRKGLDKAVLHWLVDDGCDVGSAGTIDINETKRRVRRKKQSKKQRSLSPQLVIYVSCGFDAFQRDCEFLLQSGKWKLDHAEGYLLFPGSDAIETLGVFRRV